MKHFFPDVFLFHRKNPTANRLYLKKANYNRKSRFRGCETTDFPIFLFLVYGNRPKSVGKTTFSLTI